MHHIVSWPTLLRRVSLVVSSVLFSIPLSAPALYIAARQNLYNTVVLLEPQNLLYCAYALTRFVSMIVRVVK